MLTQPYRSDEGINDALVLAVSHEEQPINSSNDEELERLKTMLAELQFENEQLKDFNVELNQFRLQAITQSKHIF